MSLADVRLICLDIDGTLTDGIGGPPIHGTVDAVRALRRRVPMRFVTNASSRPKRELFAFLRDAGFTGDPAELFTPAEVARRVLGERGHDAGILLVEPAAREDYAWFRDDPRGGTVLLCTEGHDLAVRDLQPAFRALLAGARFYSLTRNRYFKLDGELVTDLGPLAAFFSYASGREAEILGKPSALLFDAIAASAGVPRNAILMAGDDAEFDVSAAIRLGMRGALVRTGKYRPGDESRVDPPPTALIASAAELPQFLAAG